MVVTMTTMSSRSGILGVLAVLAVLAQVQVVTSEIIPLSLILDADSTIVHYLEGYITAPGYVDISQLKFVSTEEPEFVHGDDDDFFLEEDDDDNGSTIYPSNANTNGNSDNSGSTVPDDSGGSTDPPTLAPTAGGDATQAPTTVAGDGDATQAPTGGDGDATQAPTGGGGGGDDATEAPTGGGGDGDATEAPTAAAGDGDVTEAPTAGDGDDATQAPTAAGDGGDEGNRTRFLQDDGDGEGDFSSSNPAEDQAGDGSQGSVVDVVMFLLPDNCANKPNGCDWANLGVGAHDDTVEGGISYCCTEDAVLRQLCRPKEKGRLIVTSDFVGDHRQLSIPATGDFILAFEDEESQFDQVYSGDYSLVMANCNDSGREILVLGAMEWMSEHGYLQGNVFGLMFYYSGLAGIYLFLTILYWCGMKMYQDSAIPIQRYILTTLVLGLLESLFLTLDLFVLNARGDQSLFVVYTAIVLGVMKRAIFRCLGVMVSMGWGVVRESLGLALAKIVFLGLLYCGLTAARDVFTLVAYVDVQTLSTAKEDELIDMVVILTVAILAINFIFYGWIMNSLRATTEYLKNMNQTSKLRRHLQLRCIIMVSLFYSVIWLGFNFVENMNPLLAAEWSWLAEASMHANYVFVLAGVSILWRPNPNAKDYALQMELPALGEGDDEENELELTATTVPSAGEYGDYDGNDPDHPNGMRVDGAIMS